MSKYENNIVLNVPTPLHSDSEFLAMTEIICVIVKGGYERVAIGYPIMECVSLIYKKNRFFEFSGWCKLSDL